MAVSDDALIEWANRTRHLGWMEIAIKRGYSEPYVTRRVKQVNEGTDDLDRRGLHAAIAGVGITSISDLDSMLGEAERTWGAEALDQIRRTSLRLAPMKPIPAHPLDIITFIVLCSDLKGARAVLDSKLDFAFPPALTAGVVEACVRRNGPEPETVQASY